MKNVNNLRTVGAANGGAAFGVEIKRRCYNGVSAAMAHASLCGEGDCSSCTGDGCGDDGCGTADCDGGT